MNVSLVVFNLKNITRTVLQSVATCCQSPYLYKPAIIITTSLSLWRHSRIVPSQPRSHYDVVLIMTSFATVSVTYVRTYVGTYGHLTAFNV